MEATNNLPPTVTVRTRYGVDVTMDLLAMPTGAPVYVLCERDREHYGYGAAGIFAAPSLSVEQMLAVTESALPYLSHVTAERARATIARVRAASGVSK